MAISKIKTGSIADNAVTNAKVDSGYTTAIKTNPEFEGTSHMKVPVGTTAQRPVSPTAGHLRFNTTVGKMEQYDGTDWAIIDAPPVVLSVSPSTEIASDDPQSIVITGSNFSTIVTTKVIGNNLTEYTPTTVTRNSSSQITITFAGGDRLTGTNEPYDVKVINSSGLSAVLEDAFNINDVPTWSTASGSLGTVYEDAVMSTFTVAATDPESVGITYSVVSGSLPTGVSLNSSTGAITGTPNVNDSYNSSGVTHNFTLGASDGAQTINRSFSILRKWKDGSTQNQAAPSAYHILSYGANVYTNGTPEKHWIMTPSGVAKNIYCKFHGDGWAWMLSHTFGGVLGGNITIDDSEVLVKAGFFMTTEQMHNLPSNYSLSGTMSTVKNTKLRFSDDSNNYVTSQVTTNSFWAMEGNVNPYNSSYGSSSDYFMWWAHSGNLGRLHLFGDLSDVYPSNTTHIMWSAYEDANSSPYSYIGDYQGNAVQTMSSDGNTNSTNSRVPLGPLSGTGSHAYYRDGNGSTGQMRYIWAGSSS